MPSEENILALLTQEARACLPEGAYLRRDRGAALLVTDFSGEVRGFLRTPRGKLTALLPDPERILCYEQSRSAPAGTFSATLTRFRGQLSDEANARLFARGAKLFGGCTAAEFDAFNRAVRQTAAAALRTGDGGGIYALALLRDELAKRIQ